MMVRESLCAPDIELLSVSLRPFYLPREFTQLFVTLVYIHPKANMDNAVQAITRTLLQLQAISPDAPSFIMGDFNNCKPGKHLSWLPDPMALISLIMKSFEMIVKDKLMNTVQANLDPLQFAYQAGKGVDDAIITLLNMIMSHLEGTKSFVRLLFIDFTSAFNCISPIF